MAFIDSMLRFERYRHSRQPSQLPAVARRITLGLTIVCSALLASGASFAGTDNDTDWVGTWAASPQSAVESLFGTPPAPVHFDNQSIRTIARISKGGERLRIRFANTFGTEALVIGSAHVAVHIGNGVIDASTDRALTFGGSPSVTVPVNAPVVSDPINLAIGDLEELAVSVYLPEPTDGETVHSLGRQTTYISPAGDHTAAASFPTQMTTQARFFVSAIQVQANRNTMAIVTLGDSITDGYASTVDANNRWPDQLAERLIQEHNPQKFAVVNEGISGNRVLNDVIGPNALSRFDRDVIARTGARFVTVLEGINDIGFAVFAPDQAVTADEIIQGYRQLIARAHLKCIKIIGATLTPYEGAFYFTPEGEVKRQAVNDFIRNSGEFDAVIDFDRAVRDPNDPTRILPAYDSGDHLHPSDAGYDAMAHSIDLKIFQQPLRDCVAVN